MCGGELRICLKCSKIFLDTSEQEVCNDCMGRDYDNVPWIQELRDETA